ncbi:MAG: hypothetical protein GXY83_15595 [Rhodopirellula sp.]|nr:hypothetical protein [Rhodopirellula sp.]
MAIGTLGKFAEPWIDIETACNICGARIALKSKHSWGMPGRIICDVCANRKRQDEKAVGAPTQASGLTQDEAKEALALCYRLWKDLEAAQTPDEAALWLKVFMRAPSMGRLRAAIEEVKTSNRFRTQILPDISKALAVAGETAPGERQEEPVGLTGWWVECVDHEKASCIGCKMPLIWPRERDIPQEYHLIESAKQYAEQLARLYGGTWQIYRPDDKEDYRRRESQ